VGFADVATTAAGVTAGAALLVFLVWRLHRSAEAIAERYAHLVADLPVGISRTAPDGRFMEVNDALARLFGYPDRDALMATTADRLYEEGDDRAAVMAGLDRGEVVVSDLRGRRLDGTGIRVRLRSRAMLDERGRVRWYDAVTEDVTRERREHEARERFAAIVDAAGVAVVTQTVEGVITGWNDAATRLFGWTAQDVGRTVYDVSPQDEREAIRSRTERAAAGERIGPFEVQRTYLGRRLFLSIILTPIRDADGRVTGIASVAKDVTEQQVMAEQQARMTEQLQEARRMEATGRLAGGVAHDFNNLLAGIRGLGDQLAAELPADSPTRAAAEQIRRSSDEAAELIHQLLAFARRQVLRPEVLDPDTVIATQLPLLRRAVGSSVELVIEPSPEPALVVADRAHLAEILVSLVLNARDSMPGGGTVRIATRLVRAAEGRSPVAGSGELVAGMDDLNEVALTVSDTGPEIPDEAVSHLFEPFYTSREMGRGSGMGLAPVHGIVRQSGGRIDVDTGLAGTVISIRLPRATGVPAEASATVAAVSAAAGDAAGSGVDGDARKTVLVVDDDAVVRSIVRRMLQQGGFRVVEAADAAQARTIMEADPAGFDVLVSDVIMPGMRGPDLARLLRERRPDLPVVFVSGYTADEVASDFVAARTRFLAKPFTPPALLSVVRELLAEQDDEQVGSSG
jgi:PAS domain S-box-containing protein